MTVPHGTPEVWRPVADVWWSPFRDVAGVSVVHVDLRPDPARESEAFAWLDREEQVAWQKYAPGPRRRFSLCRAALRATLCRRLDCRNEQLTFGLSGYERPFAVVRGVCSPINFSVSHSGNHGLIALGTTGQLGVDLEERVPRRNLDGIVETVMGPDEQAELAALRGAQKLRLFYRIWTLKEALVKALGTGLFTDASQFQVPPRMRSGDATGLFRFPNLRSVAWGLEEIGNEQFAAGLAYELPPNSRPRADAEPVTVEATSQKGLKIG